MPLLATAPSDPSGFDTSDLIGRAEARTLWGLFSARVARTPDAVAYRDYDAQTKAWRDHSWRAIANRVDRFRAALASDGLKPGDRIAILLSNGIDWISLDLAAHASGLVVVGLYPHDSAPNNAYVLGHSEARLLLLDTQARWNELGAHRSEFPSLRSVWVREGLAADMNPSGANVHGLVDVLAPEATPAPPCLAEPHALATLIYTSGTTGRPKGVMLSHFALLWNAEATASVIPPRHDDVFLSILPLAHAFERTVGYYLPMMGGATIAYARSAQDLREDLITVRPTVLLGVPRLFERMHAGIQANVAGNIVKRALLRFVAWLGWRCIEARQRNQASPGARLLWPLVQVVAAPIMAAFGGRLRVVVSGGAPLDEEVARFLLGVGLPLVEGYGLTEAAPVVTATSLGEYVPGSVGHPLHDVALKLSGENELLVHSPSVMLGYWKDEARTARVLDPERWLSTNDLAEVKQGRIFLRGRLNEMITLSVGEKINPNVVEAEITRDPLFAQAVVVGNGRPFLAALVVIEPEAWQRFAHSSGVDPTKPNGATATAQILARLQTCLAALPRHAQVRAVHLTLAAWTIEAGLLTPTLKVKREAVQRLFAKEIEMLYQRP